MSVNPYALTTVTRQKAYMKKTDTTDDTLLEILINVATDTIESFCKRRFLLTDYSNEVYDGTGQNSLLLKNYPVVTTGKTFLISRRDGSQSDNDWNDYAAADVLVDLESGIVRLESGGRFTKLPQGLKATYSAGYAFKNNAATFVTLESIGLGDLELATWMVTKKMFEGQAVNGEIQSESLGDYSVTFRQNAQAALVDPVVASILQKYVRADAML